MQDGQKEGVGITPLPPCSSSRFHSSLSSLPTTALTRWPGDPRSGQQLQVPWAPACSTLA